MFFYKMNTRRILVIGYIFAHSKAAEKIITAPTDFDTEPVSYLSTFWKPNEEQVDPDEYLTTPQIIRRHGYESVSHVIKTEDGFLLTLHRISASKSGKIGKQPILIHHGLFGSSADFIINDNKSLAFVLSDLGYDVWLGDSRGNTYSNGHVSLSPDSSEYWNFSFHEIGIYDLPASINYITNITKEEGKIIYIGHSMGTTIFYVFASMFPQLADNTVKMMVGLAPVGFMRNVRSPLRLLAPFATEINWVASYLGLKKFVLNGLLVEFLKFDCELLNINKQVCRDTVFLFCGFDEEQLEKDMLPVILGHDPAGISTKTLLHYLQELHNNGNFMQYDYGPEGNLIKYGTSMPPSYNLSQIKVPTYFMYGENDLMVGVKDVKELSEKVGNSIGLYKVPLKTFNHIDFLWAKDVMELVYDNLIKIVGKYTK